MRWLSAGIVFLSAGVAVAADTASLAPPSSCSSPGGVCHAAGPVNGNDRKAARQAFARGLKLEQSNNLDQAFHEFDDATRLAPHNAEYLSAREMARQHLAGQYLERGNADLLEGKQPEALKEFEAALNLDPQNEFAQQRVGDATGSTHSAAPPQVVASADTLAVKPIDGIHDIHYRGDSRGLLTAIATSYGLKIIFDDNFPVRHVQFDLDNADFATAIRIASEVTKTFCVALEDNVLFAAVDSPDNHRLYDQMGMRSFYIPNSNSPQDLQEIVNTLRTLFEFKFVSLNAVASTITVRGPKGLLEAATELLGQLNSPPPDVMLDLKVFQIDHTYARTMGLHVPDTFNLYSLSSVVSALNFGQSAASILTQLQSADSSILSNPVATFGGGLTFFGLTLDSLSAELTVNDSYSRTLDHVQLRATQQKDATFKLGLRYPILNSIYSAALTNVSTSQLQALGISASAASAALASATSPASTVPSFTYEDIGLTIKIKPQVHGNADVALDVDLQFRSLGSTTVNGNPIIFNREYKGGMLLKAGEPAIVAGMITESDTKTLSGLPVISAVPALGLLTSQHTLQKEDSELLILITPHIARSVERVDAPEIWIR
jgi:general secretion pathway protein D